MEDQHNKEVLQYARICSNLPSKTLSQERRKGEDIDLEVPSRPVLKGLNCVDLLKLRFSLF